MRGPDYRLKCKILNKSPEMRSLRDFAAVNLGKGGKATLQAYRELPFPLAQSAISTTSAPLQQTINVPTEKQGKLFFSALEGWFFFQFSPQAPQQSTGRTNRIFFPVITQPFACWLTLFRRAHRGLSVTSTVLCKPTAAIFVHLHRGSTSATQQLKRMGGSFTHVPRCWLSPMKLMTLTDAHLH